mmetsp:Transcript_48937/g.36020  ORF Transcript_48937/g.36020 Transcript_48937/m.36020 type:complete len:98 (+) Transcript_48937:1002-1295(+)
MYVDYLNENARKKDLYAAIHIEDSPKEPKFDPASNSAYVAYEPEETEDYTSKVSYIIENGVSVLVYAGEYDILDGPRTIEDWLRNVEQVQANPNFFG